MFSSMTPPKMLAKFLETIGVSTTSNAIFNEGYFHHWNSGAGSRDHETYCRHLRQSLGLNNFFAKKQFIIASKDDAFDRIVAFAKSQDLQLLFASREIIWVMDVQNNVPILYSEFLIDDNLMRCSVEGDEVLVKRYMDEINVIFHDRGISITTLVGFSSQGPETTSDYLYPDREQVAKDHFFPWLKEQGMTVKDMINEYLASPESILLQYGPPGLGKSTMIRTIFLQASREKNYLSNDEQTMTNPAFPGWLAQLPRRTIIGLEDADNLTRSRENGNASMSSLLNSAQGVVQKEMKIIISTNLETRTKIEPALIRHGRCHRILHYRLLTLDEVCTIREIEGMPQVSYPEKDGYTLSEAFHWNGDDENNERGTKQAFGFNNA